jgi:hypothetical protein
MLNKKAADILMLFVAVPGLWLR